MDLKDQLKDLFPDHEPEENSEPPSKSEELNIWMQDNPLICEYSKRKGKANTLIKGYSGAKKDFQNLTKVLKKRLVLEAVIKRRLSSFREITEIKSCKS